MPEFKVKVALVALKEIVNLGRVGKKDVDSQVMIGHYKGELMKNVGAVFGV